MKKALTGALIFTVFLLGLWFIAVPDSLIKGLIESSLGAPDIKVGITGFKKGAFLNFGIGRLSLGKQAAMLVIDNVSARIRPLPLLLLHIEISVKGDIAHGLLRGNIRLAKGKNDLHISAKNAELEGIPFLQNIGINGTGKLSGDLDMKDSQGDLRFSVDDAKFKSASFSGVPLPLDLFSSVKAAVRLGGTSELTSFTLDGGNIYARLKGNIAKGNMDLKLELMPGASAVQSPVFWTLEQYKVSPGYYLLPVKAKLY